MDGCRGHEQTAKGRKTGGRRPGSPNIRTRQREQALRDLERTLVDVIPDAFKGDAHALLMMIYKDPAQPIELRLDAAKAAVRYEKPALASTTVDASVRRSISDFSDAELAALAGALGGDDGADAAPSRTH
jgi:hypothetical protein